MNAFRDINLVLRTQKDLFYSFPWSDNVVDWTFWAALLCKDGNRKGWLSDAVCHFDIHIIVCKWLKYEICEIWFMYGYTIPLVVQ